ncbi:PAS sensor protein [Oscillochloris trichoides DG-6]|uniref:histidine kinase n=1 Tax=Oscillochloris trichoides DG-6 TaxID=765420 RepID=E1IH98_9CHLR|nr:ATP-binding protein [Oscillochloris trichoides]EFO79573.1 PAS sensor protein [Oscillochloris trichoides DG-6]
MQRAWRAINSQLRFQIIGPFLLLTVIVAVVGSVVVFFQVAGSLQERFNNQMASVTRTANDAMLNQERANLQFLQEVAFAQPNPSIRAPGVPDAFQRRDVEGLKLALEPFFLLSTRRSSVGLDRLIAFDMRGQTLSDFEKLPDSYGDEYVSHPTLDISGAWFTQRIIGRVADSRGDKYAGLVQLGETLYFATITPVYVGNDVVGGLIAATRADDLLTMLRDRSQAAGVTLYNSSGEVLASTFGTGPGQAESMDAALLASFQESMSASSSIFNAQTVNGREYQFAYIPLVIRGVAVGILAPALSRDYVIATGSDTLWPLVISVFILTVTLFVLGVLIANRITAPLGELARTAEAITQGQFGRRAYVNTENEIGTLAESFNKMTGHLTDLYGQVSSESSQRAAIVESIADGIVVCDTEGRITLVNNAMRQFLNLEAEQPPPIWFSDIPLCELTDGSLGFGSQRAHDLFTLYERIVRVSANRVQTETGDVMGSVCVFQDMTAEVAVDRAKTNFIGTISHELRTPLTVIRGNADLLMRGLAGPLEDDQKVFIESIRQHAGNMTSLISNVIMIAGLDSGSLATDIEPLSIFRPADDAAWPLQSAIKAKGLTLRIEIAKDLPEILADFDQLRMIFHQLIDNARRYTAQGEIIVRAQTLPEYMLVEVADTGRGIAPDMHEQIFERFIRGDGASEGINSSERGIGLGLAICKQLVERQGGKIWVESTPGQGSSFYFTLRYAHATPNTEKPAAPLAAAA